MREKVIIHILIFLTPILYYAIWTWFAVIGDYPQSPTATMCGVAGGMTLIGLLTRLDKIS